MNKIVILSASIRTGRKSNRVALYFKNFISNQNLGIAEIVDLKELQLPLFEERLKFLSNPPQNALLFAEKIKSADGVIIVTPEYNGGYPAGLKNAIDFLHAEWLHKPVAISTVSDGIFGGSQVITSLQFVLWKMKALTVTSMFPVPKISESFAEDGTPADPETISKRAAAFIGELNSFIEASKKLQ